MTTADNTVNKKKSETNVESTVHLKTQFVGIENDPGESPCLLCNLTFILPTNEKVFLSHLFEEHRLIIGDVWKIASLRSYIHYWRIKMKDEPLTTFCTTMLMDCTPDGKPSKNEVYYLLSDCITEDKTLRDELRRVKLEWALAQQSQERTDTNFKRGCMFCRMEFNGLRATYLKHLSEKHNLQLGKVDNLVFIDKFLNKIQYNIENLICIYCEKIFKDRTVLKEHMRKKLHKRINPNNRTYDQFYITNYLEPENTWRRRQNASDDAEESTGFSDNEDEDNSWSDWNDESIGVTCLFCSEITSELSAILDHMKTEHDFDFERSTKNLNFYEKIKVVNYIRKQIYEKKCVYCDKESDNILEHMKSKDHFKIPAARVWNQPEFYFPMFETDSFLYHLDSNSDDENDIEMGCS
ncbi:zinc finger protein 277 isoform X2 [Chelonus insularis]|uniref:zinc finger protein 277 isoform X2 n=1 Tax=Chelonus insularis TaxID=460826 RepID=UPI00158A0E31|nr:zinc finger protein 277 isoform X2 [Chelonus insularis]